MLADYFTHSIYGTNLAGLERTLVEHVPQKAEFARQTEFFIAEMIEQGTPQRTEEVQNLWITKKQNTFKRNWNYYREVFMGSQECISTSMFQHYKFSTWLKSTHSSVLGMKSNSSSCCPSMSVELRPCSNFRARGWGCVRWKAPCMEGCEVKYYTVFATQQVVHLFQGRIWCGFTPQLI